MKTSENPLFIVGFLSRQILETSNHVIDSCSLSIHIKKFNLADETVFIIFVLQP